MSFAPTLFGGWPARLGAVLSPQRFQHRARIHGQAFESALRRPTDGVDDSFDKMPTVVSNISVFDVVESATFSRWIEGLRDRRAVARIQARFRNVTMGYFGDTRSVGDGVSEMRIHYVPGYRLYFIRQGTSVVALLCGGDKDSLQRDIALAKRIAAQWG